MKNYLVIMKDDLLASCIQLWMKDILHHQEYPSLYSWSGASGDSMWRRISFIP